MEFNVVDWRPRRVLATNDGRHPEGGDRRPCIAMPTSFCFSHPDRLERTGGPRVEWRAKTDPSFDQGLCLSEDQLSGVNRSPPCRPARPRPMTPAPPGAPCRRGPGRLPGRIGTPAPGCPGTRRGFGRHRERWSGSWPPPPDVDDPEVVAPIDAGDLHREAESVLREGDLPVAPGLAQKLEALAFAVAPRELDLAAPATSGNRGHPSGA